MMCLREAKAEDPLLTRIASS